MARQEVYTTVIKLNSEEAKNRLTVLLIVAIIP